MYNGTTEEKDRRKNYKNTAVQEAIRRWTFRGLIIGGEVIMLKGRILSVL